MHIHKEKTRSFKSQTRTKSSRFDRASHTPEKSEGSYRDVDAEMLKIRFKGKNLETFEPGKYVTGQLSIDDVIDLKEVFDTYDSTGMSVLLPNDLTLLLAQNGYSPNKKTVYEILAEFDEGERGGLSFNDFMRAMACKPYLNENRKLITTIFKKYDMTNKGYIDINDMREINRHVKENLDDETLKLMVKKCDSNNDGKISFEDFYSVMVKNIY